METLDCGHPPSEHSTHTTGYGTDSTGRRYCYACCADRDREQMILDGHTVLYWHSNKLSNWSGSLTFTPTHYRTVRGYGFGPITHAWFVGPDGAKWIARHSGNWTQLAHCRRLKEQR